MGHDLITCKRERDIAERQVRDLTAHNTKLTRLLKEANAEIQSLKGKGRRAPDGWVRDLDGTGSYHPCAEGDPGAVPYWLEKA